MNYSASCIRTIERKVFLKMEIPRILECSQSFLDLEISHNCVCSSAG